MRVGRPRVFFSYTHEQIFVVSRRSISAVLLRCDSSLFLSAICRLATAISPGYLGLGEGACANTETAPNERDATTTTVVTAIRRMYST